MTLVPLCGGGVVRTRADTLSKAPGHEDQGREYEQPSRFHHGSKLPTIRLQDPVRGTYSMNHTDHVGYIAKITAITVAVHSMIFMRCRTRGSAHGLSGSHAFLSSRSSV